MRDLDPEEARAIVDPVPAYDRGGASSLRRLRGAIQRATACSPCSAPQSRMSTNPQRAFHGALAMQEELHRYSDGRRFENHKTMFY
jgi:hypothetical protein